jgi:hypothetical protein
MNTFFLILTYILGLSDLLLSFYFLYTHSKNEIRKVMFLFTFSLGIWVIISAHTSYISFSSSGYYEMALVYFAGSVAITAMLHLALIMPYKIYNFDKYHAILLYIPTIFFFFMLFFTRTLVVSFENNLNGFGYINSGELYPLYNIYNAVIYLLGLSIFFHRSQIGDGQHKKSSRIIFLSLLVGGLPAIVIYFILATFFTSVPTNNLVGVLPTAFWVFSTSYIVMRK